MWQSIQGRLQRVIVMVLCLAFVESGVLWLKPASALAADAVETKSLITAVEQVAKQSVPAVVHIEVTERQEVANPLVPFENDPFFKYFFGNPKNIPKKFQRQIMGIGSGIIIDADGHILTNNHVVGGATKIQVALSDGRVFTEKNIKVIGTDPKTDLAVIQITEKGPFPYVMLGDSDKVAVGQWVVAIGQPRGLTESVTQGIISAKHRRGITSPSGYEDFLQTDAAINPGNSGGPLLDLNGQVIGINTAIASESGGFEGIGFAIPSNMAAYVMKQLISSGKVERGWMGALIQDLTPDLAQSMGLSTTKGALIADVVKGSPAEKAGFKRGDVVVNYDGKDISDAGSLRNDVATTPIGKDVAVTVLRSGAKQNLTLKVGSMQEAQKMETGALKSRLGVAVRPVSEQEMSKYGLQSQQGVEISWIDPHGPLGKAGLEVGDIILEVNGQAITGAGDLEAVAATLKPNQAMTILVVDHRTGQTGYVRAKM